jgi:hypothetical protein
MGFVLFAALAAVLVSVLFVFPSSSNFQSVTLQSIEYFARPHSGKHFEEIVGPSAWIGSRLKEEDYMFNLSLAFQTELTRAVKAISSNKTLGELKKEDLILPSALEVGKKKLENKKLK